MFVAGVKNVEGKRNSKNKPCRRCGGLFACLFIVRASYLWHVFFFVCVTVALFFCLFACFKAAMSKAIITAGIVDFFILFYLYAFVFFLFFFSKSPLEWMNNFALFFSISRNWFFFYDVCTTLTKVDEVSGSPILSGRGSDST